MCPRRNQRAPGSDSAQLRSRYTTREVLATYRRHPLRERAILARIGTSRRGGLTELDLALDNETEVTDQNHVGGVAFVVALGQLAKVDSKSVVLDLGCGLGGSARVLAYRFGCHVLGIDFSPERFRQAIRLTRLVGLDDFVTFQRANIETVTTPRSPRYDVIWGQSSWVHVRDRVSFVRRWLPSLRRGGRIAVEDTFLARRPTTRWERVNLERLEEIWKAYLVPFPDWCKQLTALTLSITHTENLTEDMNRHFRSLERASREAPVPLDERRAWRRAIRLAEAGVLSYRRCVAVR